MNRSIESLARAYQDQTLSEDDVRELDQLLKTNAGAREIFLRETNLIATLEDIACDEVAELPTVTMLSLPRQLHDETSQASPLRWTMAAGWFVATAAVVLLMASLYSISNPVDKAIATIVGLSGPSQWTGDGGQVRSDLTIGMQLPGGTIDGLSPESWFALEFTDGSTVRTSGNSMLAYSEVRQKVLHLKSGNLSADVAPQPDGRPMLIHTRSAVLEVIGTSFDVDADLASTALNVTEGMVRVKRLSDGRQVEVPAQHQVVAAADHDLSVNQISRVAYQWRSRLEEGASRTFGRWLPAMGDAGPLLHCIPYMTKDGRTIYTSSFQVTAAEGAPIMTSDRSIVSVRGRLDRATDLYVGMSLKTEDGTFAGRFQVVLPSEQFQGQEVFEISLPLEDFTLDPSLASMKREFAKSASDLVVDTVWCHTLYVPVGLAVATIELAERAE
ncbi:fec operon regulator FecR [Rubripirellula tenax]|uniref:Fec operon regulator FecR n=1 Tax=Rubripirellula tenax TaxID=2528015 RepID=A0A5C6EBA3_9BACT|nr:FecR family protein [Rubripirellula tenax]TWU44459.1 fec operon regulator FecR [Rubripirellula tenax]